MPANSIESLRHQHCVPRKGKEDALSTPDLESGLALLPDWRLAAERNEILKEFRFADYFHTMAFVNAVATIAHREDHHPDLAVHYAKCEVTFATHDAGGVTLNDVICAAKTERLFA